MIRAAILLCCAALAGCASRPLSLHERAFLSTIHGPALDTRPVRLHDGALVGEVTYTRPQRPRVTCQERIFPPPPPDEREITVSPGAVAVFHNVFMRRDLYRDDYLPEYPERAHLYAMMLLAHEMTHVWQWQHRGRTGYNPLKAMNEHAVAPDPYLFDLATTARFLDYGYEQQGAIVEEYVCCRTLDPGADRTRRLHDMLSGAFRVADLDRRLDGMEIVIPWAEAETRGICEGPDQG